MSLAEKCQREMAASLMAGKRVFTFQKAGKGSITASGGLINMEMPFTWSINGDSLHMDMEAVGTKQTDIYQLDRDGDKIVLMKADSKMTLSKVE